MLRCDNYTAIYCILQRGSRDDFRDYITKRIFDLARNWNFTIQISYVASQDNCSDRVSHVFKGISVHTEWELSNYDFNKIKDWWIVKPEVNMFASNQNRKLHQFMSWKPCVDSLHVDSFTINWQNIKGYLFVPFSLISRAVKKMYQDRVQHLCRIFPQWETKSWWPALMRLVVGPVYSLPKEAASRLRIPWDHSLQHPMKHQLWLIFVNLSIQSLKIKTLKFPE